MKSTFYSAIAAILFFCQCEVFAHIIIIPQDHKSIQTALNVCKSNDTILVSQGIYYENITWPNKRSICLISKLGPDSTIIDGRNKGSVIIINTDVDSHSVIEGFTIRNGKALIGGGIYCTSKNFIIKNNYIQHNIADNYGSGIACLNKSNPIILNNKIENNKITNPNRGGGTIYCFMSTPVIKSNKILNNKAYTGSGIYCNSNSSPKIIFNEISNNNAYNTGGGIMVNLNSSPLIKRNKVYKNYAAIGGGGISCYRNSNPLIEDNEIYENSTQGFGGGFDIWFESSPIIRNNFVSSNSSAFGAGINCWRDCNPEIINCMISNNKSRNNGGGIYFNERCNPKVIGCTIINNSSESSGGGIYSNHCDLLFEITLIKNNKASESGGGCYFLFGNIIFTGTSIIENKASKGGGIYFDFINSVKFSEKKLCNVFLNTADYQGDDFYAIADKEIYIRLDTFSVKLPNNIHAYPFEFLDLSFLNTKIVQLHSDFYVSSSGNDNNEGTSKSEPLKTLNIAVSKLLADSSHPVEVNLLTGEYAFHYIPEFVSLSTNFQSDLMYSGNKINVFTPLWKSTWAILIYILIVLGSIFTVWKFQSKRLKVKYENEMNRFEIKKLHEIDEMKSNFFANISHEFRTPLTLILGPMKEIIDRTKELKTKEEAEIAHKSANRLHGLVNQLLDLSKLEAGSMKLRTYKENIIPILKGLVLSFASLTERKNITLNFKSQEEVLVVFTDRDKVEKIVTNILSNAFKFTDEGGRIDVNVRSSNGKVEITVSDTGIGIPKEKLDKIFDRFYQTDDTHNRKAEGTGIGLALTKELVELHKGEIKVESEEEKGTTFTISFPLGRDHLLPEEIVEGKVEIEEKPTPFATEIEEDKKEEEIDIDLITETEKSLLLIVDDNADVRTYIRGHLDESYRVLEAVDGKDGMDKALEYIPDMIVSDVMMPEMDGFELCEELKNDERTSHIPVILLTAKAASEDKIEGLETGADDYIMKPFDAKELQVRIKNLIEQRKKLRERFHKEATIPIKKGKYSQIDEEFLKKTMEVIEKHISEPEFSLGEFGREIGMSRTQLHRKVRALTDYSPHNFLRFIRLNHAAELLSKGTGNVTEIAYDVGFSSLSHFAKAFKEQFGKNPSDYNKVKN
ncbi:ATP-binding protein [Bacteroidota bacterium]